MNLLILLLVPAPLIAKDGSARSCYPDPRRGAPSSGSSNATRTPCAARGADRGRQPRRTLRRQPGYRIPPDGLALPEIRLEPRRGGRARGRRPGLGARHARQGDRRALGKLTPQGFDSTLGPRVVEPAIRADEPAFDPFWDAAQARQASSSPTAPREAEPTHDTSSRGGWSGPRGGGTPSDSTRPRRRAGLPALPGGRAGAAVTGRPERTSPGGHRRTRDRPPALAGAPPRAEAAGAPGHGCRAAPRPTVESASPVPTRSPDGTGSCSRRARAGRRPAHLRRRRVRRGAGRAARRGGVPAAGGRGGRAGWRAHPGAAARETRSPGCSPWCRTSTRTGPRCASTRRRPPLGIDARSDRARPLRALHVRAAGRATPTT